MNIDAALRYHPVVSFLKKNNKGGKTVLEVGSGTNGIAEFYNGKVVGVDSDYSKTADVKRKNITHQKASITKLPFKNEMFKYVICLDTFEHLKISDRSNAIKELVRVSKKDGTIIVGFPAGKKSSTFEKAINALFKKVQGRDHPWILEHIENGLPDTSEIEKIFRNENINEITRKGNGNLFLWFLMHFLFTVPDGKRGSKFINKLKLPMYKVLIRFNIPPFYRQLITVKK